VRLGTDEHDQVASAEPAHDVEPVLGPTNDAHLALVHLDLRTLLGEVVERIGVDLGDRDGGVGRGEPVERGARRAGDVEQARQGDQHHGRPQDTELLGVERQHVFDVHAVRVGERN
jgi:hypothetical protein